MKSAQVRTIVVLFFAVLFTGLFAKNVTAQANLLSNPGFETGNLDGWSVSGNSQNYGVNIAGYVISGTDPSFGTMRVLVHSGTYAGYTLVCSNCLPGPEYLELAQPVTLVPGNTYTVSYWLGDGSSQGFYNGTYVTLNGSLINLTTVSGINPGYQVMSGSFIATQANSTILFHLQGSGTGAAGLSFDDLSLTQTGSPATNGGYLYLINTADDRIASYQTNTVTGWIVQGVGSPFPTGVRPDAVTTSGLLTYVADLSSLQISGYLTNQTTGTMTQVAGSPYTLGFPPVAIAIDRSWHFVYATGAQNGRGSIAGWAYNTMTGALTPVAGSPFSAGVLPGAIAFSRNGQYAYVVDRGNNNLLAYSVNTVTGALTQIAGSPYRTGSYPAAIATDVVANFLYVANAGDNTISAFQIAANGTLTEVPGSPFATGRDPWWLAFDSAQHYLYAANNRANSISAYAINPTTGALTQIVGSPFATGNQPNSMATSHNFLYVNTTSGVLGYRINSSTGGLASIPGFPPTPYGTALATAGGGGPN